jgi:hypothetical protein
MGTSVIKIPRVGNYVLIHFIGDLRQLLTVRSLSANYCTLDSLGGFALASLLALWKEFIGVFFNRSFEFIFELSLVREEMHIHMNIEVYFRICSGFEYALLTSDIDHGTT